MLKLPEKGSLGYFDRKKKFTLAASVVSFLIVVIIYVAGILIYHTNKSVFTVMAAVAVLPAAKILISYIIVAPYKSFPRDRYEEIESLIGKNKEGRILCDILLASAEKSIIAGTVVIWRENVFMFSDNKKAQPGEAENYMKKILENCNYSSIKMYTDYEQFKRRIQQSAAGFAGVEESDEKSLQRLKNMRERIEHNICIYTV